MRKTTPLEHALQSDPISEFEHISGHDYHENSDAENMGMLGLAMLHNEHKDDLLRQANDTRFSMSADEYARNIEEFGFKNIYSEPFTVEHCGSVKHDSLEVYWHDWGLLLYFDTYCEERNGGKVFYNWIPHDGIDRWQCTSSGGLREIDGQSIWAGDHDCREALRHNMRQLYVNGTLLPKWKAQPFSMWITHYGEKDTNWEAYQDRTARRLDKLPKRVQRAILHRGP
jgi:hypothetical protein